MPNLNDEIADALLKHNIDLLRVDASTRAKVLGMIKGLESNLIKKLKLIDPTEQPTEVVFRNKRLKQLMVAVGPTIDNIYKRIEETVTNDLAFIAQSEGAVQAQELQRALNVELQSKRLNKNLINSLANNVAVEGEIVKKWWKEQSFFLRNTFNKQIQAGMLGGETIQDIVRRIRGTKAAGFKDGIMETTRRRATALVRSSVLSVANDARLEMYKQNANVIEGMQWTSTLDSRTTDICMALDGSSWTLDGKPMNGTRLPFRGAPPAHWQCRSTLTPITKSWDKLIKDPNIGKQLKDLPPGKAGSLRASMDGLVASKLNYEQWLKTKPEAFQLEVLGKTKFNLWKKGLLSFTDLIDQSHNPLTIQQLLAKVGEKPVQITKSNKAIKEAQIAKQQADAKEKELLEAKIAREQQKKALIKLDEIMSGDIPYKTSAWKTLKDKAEYQTANTFDRLEMIEKLAEKNKQKAMLASYTESKAKGLTPSDDAIAAYNKAPDAQKTMVNLDIDHKIKTVAAEKKIAEYETGTQVQKKAVFEAKKGKEFDYDILSPIQKLEQIEKELALAKTVANNAAKVTQYKKAILSGKTPSPGAQSAFNALPEAKKQKVLADIAKKQPPVPTQAISDDEILFSDKKFTQVGSQRGSNPGGLFQDVDSGDKWYIKTDMAEDVARNEILANKFYELAGVDVPDIRIVKFADGRTGVATRFIDDLARDGTALKGLPGTAEGFGMDAWLANWDVVGLNFDNLLIRNGTKAFRIDTGGALRYRAQGGLKGNMFGKVVDEIDSLRNPNTNPQSANIFGSMTQSQLDDSVRKVLVITDDQIDDMIKKWGPLNPQDSALLADTLKARRDDLAKRFPALKPKVKRAKKQGERLSKQEIKSIDEARSNGYAVKSDFDQIEDQNILVWRDLDTSGNKVTKMQLKVTKEGEKKIQATLANQGESLVIQQTNLENLENDMVKAIKGIRSRLELQGKLDVTKDLPRARVVVDQYNEILDDLKKIPDIDTDTLRTFTETYETWIVDLKTLVKDFDEFEKADDVIRLMKMKAPTLVNLDEVFTPPPFVMRKAKETTAQKIAWTQEQSTFHGRNIKNGHIVGVDNVGVSFGKSYVTTIDDVEIRWHSPANNGSVTALQNRVEVTIKGDNVESGFKALEKLGVNTATPQLVDEELLYLRKIANVRNENAEFVNAIGKSTKTETLVKKGRAWLEEKVGVPISQMPDYDPRGIRKAYEQGYVHTNRPDLTVGNNAEAWKNFRDNHVMIHEFWKGDHKRFDDILNSGGQFITTNDKLRRGINLNGGSPEGDLASGGAEYFFTRIRNKAGSVNEIDRGNPVYIVYDSDILKRTDAISYDHDTYGNVAGNFIKENRKARIQEWEHAAGERTNETIFKHGFNVVDNLKHIVLKSEREVKETIDIFKKHKITEVNGRKIDEIIVTKDQYKTLHSEGKL